MNRMEFKLILNYIRIISFLLVFTFCMSCSPKATEVVQVEETVEPEVKPNPENVGCETFEDLSAVNAEEAQKSFVLYKDFLKAKEFDKAYDYWKMAFKLAPSGNGKVKYQYDDGITLAKHYYDHTTDSVSKKQWFENAMAIYDKRLNCDEDERSYINGRKAFDLYYKFPGEVSDGELFNMFAETIDSDGVKSPYFIVNPFTRMLLQQIATEAIDLDRASDYAIQIFDIIEYGKANCDRECEAWEIIEEYAPARLEILEGLAGFYDCAYYTEKYYPLISDTTSNCDTINLVYQRLRRGQCDLESEELQMLQSLRMTHCKPESHTPGPLKLAYEAYNEGDYKVAIEQFRIYVDEVEDLEKKAKYALIMATIYYRDLKDFPKSRSLALEAAEYKANWGEPYLLIGKLYASSGPLCGPGRGWDSQIVTWPAIDKFQYAKQIDPSISKEANKWIYTYKKYMPTKEDIFLRNIKAGSAFTVKCWIQEKTTVRTAD